MDGENGNYDYLMGADLDMGNPEVVAELDRWGEWYWNETGVDGFRLDAVKHIRFTFFTHWLEALRESDAILREEFAAAGLDKKVWQYFTIVPDLKSVGVRNNARCEEWPAIIRAVNTVDAMTAEIEEIPYEVLHRVTKRIITEVPGINRVCYDLTPKPTGTIEWE